MKTPPDTTTDLPPCTTALQAFVKTKPDIGRFAFAHRVPVTDHAQRPFFEACLEVLNEAAADPLTARMIEISPLREGGFPIEEQRAMLLEAQEAFKQFKTSDPIGSRLAARDAEDEKAEQALRARVAKNWAIRTAKEEAERIAARLTEFTAQIGVELLHKFDLSHPDIDSDAASKLLADPLESNVVAVGHPGTGKTRCLVQKALENIRDGFCVEWTTASEFADTIGSLADSTERPAAAARLADLADAEILFIDDLGSMHFTTARTSRLFDLLDHRHRHRLVTAVSTNHGLGTIRKMLASDKITADRILRRLVGTKADPRATTYFFQKK